MASRVEAAPGAAAIASSRPCGRNEAPPSSDSSSCSPRVLLRGCTNDLATASTCPAGAETCGVLSGGGAARTGPATCGSVAGRSASAKRNGTCDRGCSALPPAADPYALCCAPPTSAAAPRWGPSKADHPPTAAPCSTNGAGNAPPTANRESLALAAGPPVVDAALAGASARSKDCADQRGASGCGSGGGGGCCRQGSCS